MRKISIVFFVILLSFLLLASCTMLSHRDNTPASVDVYNSSATDALIDGGSGTNEKPNPTVFPIWIVTEEPSPTEMPTASPSPAPSPVPTQKPSEKPVETVVPSETPSVVLTDSPSESPSKPKKTIYLTFDDGPCPNTLKVLDILDKYGVKATFFTVGYFVDRYPEIIQQTVQRGHLVGCHSYTHEFNKCYASIDSFLKEIKLWEAAVQKAIGSTPSRICVRFPGGTGTNEAKRIQPGIFTYMRQRGYRWFDWNAGNNDKWAAGNTNGLSHVDYLIDSYYQSMKWHDGQEEASVIFLCHDTDDTTVQMLSFMIEDLLKKGYEFELLNTHPDWNS